MMFPINFQDISLLLAIIALILLIASELLSQNYGKVNILINKKRLRNVAIMVSIFFLITVAIKIYEIIISI